MKPTVSTRWAASLLLLLGGCAGRPARDWGSFDILRDPVLPPELRIQGKEISPEDYAELRRLGEGWFRTGAFGNERSISDVMGVFQAIVDFPCADGSAPGCRKERPILPFVLAAVDALDGVEGNLFQGNGGPTGAGYTSDLVIRFPRGTTLSGVPVPEELHSGLDIEAGEVLPIGIDWVPVSTEEGLQKPYLPELTGWGYEGAPEGKVRFRLACAACHYSLDVDADGKADIRSTKLDNPTPGSPYQPEHGWGVGNQDIAIGWLFSMSSNPLVGSLLLAGALGQPGSEPSIAYLDWLMATYKSNPKLATQEVIAGMLAQPRGYADVTTDGIYNPTQLPPPLHPLRLALQLSG